MLGERDPRSVTFTDNSDVLSEGDESVTSGIFELDHVGRTNVLFDRNDHTDTTATVTGSAVSDVTNVELNVTDDLTGFEVNLDGIGSLNFGHGVTDGTTIVGREVRDTTLTSGDLGDLAKLDLSFFNVFELVEEETALRVEEETEAFASLRDRDDI